MLFCCDCFFAVTFLPSKSIHFKVWALLHFLFWQGIVWEPIVHGWLEDGQGSTRVLWPPPPLQKYLGGRFSCQGALHPVSFRVQTDPHLFFFHFVAERNGAASAILHLCNMTQTSHVWVFCASPTTHLWLGPLQREVQQVITTVFAFPCPAWKMTSPVLKCP